MNELPIIISCVIIIQLNKDGDDDDGEHRKLNVLFVKKKYIFTRITHIIRVLLAAAAAVVHIICT